MVSGGARIETKLRYIKWREFGGERYLLKNINNYVDLVQYFMPFGMII